MGSHELLTLANFPPTPEVPDRKEPEIKHKPSTVKVEKPWGRFEQYTHNLQSTVKIITVAPGGIPSRQYHRHHDELWVILYEGACVELDGEVLYPDAEERLFIPRETTHRLYSTGSSPVRVLEISFGEFDEEYIVRFRHASDADPLGSCSPGARRAMLWPPPSWCKTVEWTSACRCASRTCSSST